uniref:ATP synthase complex subunit 8 n=1 Tax=Trachys auricollis TaxID=2705174 RepID=A0A6C0AA65_9COLE|nr:ATP synthase F0 subunit 8 [Trachys auricollis]QHS71062.1 ATP synthase F0 subunit 8 [Trachys auricollis]
MPQMAPLSWLLLFSIFSLTFIIFVMINYYSIIYTTPKNSLKGKVSNKINWKW